MHVPVCSPDSVSSTNHAFCYVLHFQILGIVRVMLPPIHQIHYQASITQDICPWRTLLYIHHDWYCVYFILAIMYYPTCAVSTPFACAYVSITHAILVHQICNHVSITYTIRLLHFSWYFITHGIIHPSDTLLHTSSRILLCGGTHTLLSVVLNMLLCIYFAE